LTTTSLLQPTASAVAPESDATRGPYVERHCFLGLPDHIRYAEDWVHFLEPTDQQKYGTPAVHGLPESGNFLQRMKAHKAFWTWWWAAPRCGTCRLPIRIRAVGGPERAATGRPVPADRAGSSRLAAARMKGLLTKVETAPPGTRNDTLNICAHRAFLDLGDYYQDQTITDAFLAAGMAAGLPHNEALRTVQSASGAATEGRTA
jgi:hypothetical protein